jgi:hypothetical protein
MANKSAEELEVLPRARYPVIYVVTWEEARVEETLAQIARRRDKKLYLWSVARGITQYGTPAESRKRADARTTDPSAALDHVLESMENAIYVFRDLHAFFNSPPVTRRIRELAAYLKNSYKTLVIVSPTLSVPSFAPRPPRRDLLRGPARRARAGGDLRDPSAQTAARGVGLRP